MLVFFFSTSTACKPGFFGSNCSLNCPRNTFGENCSGLCPPLCFEEDCHHAFGCLRNSTNLTSKSIPGKKKCCVGTKIVYNGLM